MRAIALLLGFAVSAASVAAQADSTRPPADVGPSRVLTHVFATPSREFVRVGLDSGLVYRAVLDSGRFRLEVRSMVAGAREPLVSEVGEVRGEEAVYEIRPLLTGEYEIRIYGSEDVPVRLTVDRRPNTHQ